MPLGGLPSGLRIAAVLPFVELDDAFEPVSGIEGARTEGLRLRRLDAEAEVDHGIDARMRADQVEHLGDGVARLAPRKVDRIVAAPSRRHARVDRLTEVIRQRDELEPGLGTGVGGEHTPAPRRREYHRAPAARERLRREGRCPLEGVLDTGCTERPDLRGHTVEDAVIARERAGVTRRGALALGGDAPLQKDQWLPRGERPRSLREASAVGNAFHVAERHGRLRVRSEVVEVVRQTELRGVAR